MTSEFDVTLHTAVCNSIARTQCYFLAHADVPVDPVAPKFHQECVELPVCDLPLPPVARSAPSAAADDVGLRLRLRHHAQQRWRLLPLLTNTLARAGPNVVAD
eukprot:3341021-Pyramimonas_sp.AAC.1